MERVIDIKNISGTKFFSTFEKNQDLTLDYKLKSILENENFLDSGKISQLIENIFLASDVNFSTLIVDKNSQLIYCVNRGNLKITVYNSDRRILYETENKSFNGNLPNIAFFKLDSGYEIIMQGEVFTE